MVELTDPGRRLTILVHDLGPGVSSSSALAFGTWLRSQGWRLETVALWDGTWAGAFAALGPTWVANREETEIAIAAPTALDLHHRSGAIRRRAWSTPPAESVIRELADGIQTARLGRVADGVRGQAVRRRLARETGPVWMAGTAGSALLHYLPDRRPVIVQANRYEPPIADHPDLAVLARRPNAWVVADDDEAAALSRLHLSGSVTVVPDVLQVEADDGPSRPQVERRAAMGLRPDVPIVAGTGEVDWWNVPDLFVPLAWELVHVAGRDLDLVWAAGHSTERMLWPLRHDLRHAGLADRVHISPPGMAIARAIAIADVVALTRRGPLSPSQVLEIEAIGVPVVRAAGEGETPGRSGASTVVPYLDEQAMAQAVIEVLADPGARSAARAAAAEVRANHDPAVLGPRLVELIHSLR